MLPNKNGVEYLIQYINYTQPGWIDANYPNKTGQSEQQKARERKRTEKDKAEEYEKWGRESLEYSRDGFFFVSERDGKRTEKEKEQEKAQAIYCKKDHKKQQEAQKQE